MNTVPEGVLLLDPLVWLALAAPFAAQWFLLRTRAGLILRAVGESGEVAHAFGYKVVRIRLEELN